MKIVGIGDNVIDRYLNLKKIYPGGNAVNVAVHMARNGAEAAYLGVLADDYEGMLITNALREENVDISQCIFQKGGSTKRCDVNVIQGERQFVDFSLGDNWEKIEQFSEKQMDYLRKFDLLHTSCNAKIEDEVRRLAQLPGVLTFDFSTKEKYRTEEFLHKVCPKLDMALFSWDGSEKEFLEFAEYVHQKGAVHVLATMGIKGAVCYNGEEFIQGHVHPVDAIDTMGAGDSYLAAFLTSLLKSGWKKGAILTKTQVAEAMEQAAVYSAKNCLHDGGFGHGAAL